LPTSTGFVTKPVEKYKSYGDGTAYRLVVFRYVAVSGRLRSIRPTPTAPKATFPVTSPSMYRGACGLRQRAIVTVVVYEFIDAVDARSWRNG
jgi:hypothetical protein